MKKSIFLLLLFVHIYSFGQKNKCDQFHVGNFTYSDAAYKGWKVFRTETTQVETDSVRGYRIEGSIRWISNCEYELAYTKVSTTSLESLIGTKMRIKIVYISGNKIICQSDQKVKMEMVKID